MAKAMPYLLHTASDEAQTSGENPMTDTKPWLGARFSRQELQRQLKVSKLVKEGVKSETQVKLTAAQAYRGDQKHVVIKSVEKYSGDNYQRHGAEMRGMLTDRDKSRMALRSMCEHGLVKDVFGQPIAYVEGYDDASPMDVRQSGEIVGKIRNTPVGQRIANERADSPFKKARKPFVVERR